MDNAQNIKNLLLSSKNPVVVVGTDASAHDAIPGAVAIAKFIEENNKKADLQLVYLGDKALLDEELTALYDVSSQLEVKGNSLKIKVDMKNLSKPIEKLNWEKSEDDTVLTFELKPIDKSFSENRVKIVKDLHTFDLLVAIGISTKEKLLAINEDKSMFNDSKIINIDVNAGNEAYGTENIIQEGNTISYLIFNMFAALKEKISREVAKSLLTGFKKED